MKSEQYFKDREAELAQKKKGNRKWLLIILILLLLLFLVQLWLNKKVEPVEVPKQLSSSSIEQDIAKLRDSLRIIDSLNKVIQQKKDSLLQEMPKESSSSLKSSSSALKLAPAMPSDSIPPTFSVDPLPGKFYESIQIAVQCSEEKCLLEYDLGNGWQKYGTPVELAESVNLKIRAQDSVGNLVEDHFRYTLSPKSSRCASGMVLIEGAGSFCIDTYEWPNQKGAEPKSMVSQAEAEELCVQAGKQLCSVEEWQQACAYSDAGSRKYSYGNRYQKYCTASSKSPSRSGYKTNCRSWSGVYDMSGNLWEWTRSKDKKLKTKFLAVGGNYAGNDLTSCTETTYSFFAQNQYPGLGFRCCSVAK